MVAHAEFGQDAPPPYCLVAAVLVAGLVLLVHDGDNGPYPFFRRTITLLPAHGASLSLERTYCHGDCRVFLHAPAAFAHRAFAPEKGLDGLILSRPAAVAADLYLRRFVLPNFFHDVYCLMSFLSVPSKYSFIACWSFSRDSSLLRVDPKLPKSCSFAFSLRHVTNSEAFSQI